MRLFQQKLFDFESMLSKFDKAREQTANDLGIAKYDKDDFFDTMSSDTTQKENRSAYFQRMAEQRKLIRRLLVEKARHIRAFTVMAEAVAEAEAEEVEDAIRR